MSEHEHLHIEEEPSQNGWPRFEVGVSGRDIPREKFKPEDYSGVLRWYGITPETVLEHGRILTLAPATEPVLRKAVKNVEAPGDISPELVLDFVTTIERQRLIGMAANQTGIDANFFVYRCGQTPQHQEASHVPYTIVVNPCITNESDEKYLNNGEGCATISDAHGKLLLGAPIRPRWLDIEYDIPVFSGATMSWQRIARRVKGLEAAVFSHEIDHLKGRFFIDRLDPRSPMLLDAKKWRQVQYSEEGQLSRFSR